MWGNVVDPLTAWLILLGIGSWRLLGWRRFLAIVYFVTVFSFLTTGISHYAYLSVTRTLHGMLPFALLSSLGFSALVGGNKKFAVTFAIFSVLWVTLYTTVKIESYNPYQRELEYISTFLKPVQEGAQTAKHIFIFPPDHDPYIARSMTTSFGYENQVIHLQEGPDLTNRLQDWLQKGTGTVSFWIMDQCKSKEELIRIAQEVGVGSVTEFARYDQPTRVRISENPICDALGEQVMRIITLFERER